jgi:hypothetical protein
MRPSEEVGGEGVRACVCVRVCVRGEEGERAKALRRLHVKMRAFGDVTSWAGNSPCATTSHQGAAGGEAAAHTSCACGRGRVAGRVGGREGWEGVRGAEERREAEKGYLREGEKGRAKKGNPNATEDFS